MGIIEKLLMKILPYYEIIKNENGKDVVYLRRFYILRNNKCGIYLHHILEPDRDDDPHDHPFDFISLILKGGYLDEQWTYGEVDGKFKRTFVGFEEVKPFTIIKRKAEHVHRVILKGNQPAWTLVFLGPHKRDWGFITEKAWVFWREYLNNWTDDHA